MNEYKEFEEAEEEKKESKVIPFIQPKESEDAAKSEDYKKTVALYQKETEKMDEDYDLLKYTKEYIKAYNKIQEALKKSSNLALAGIIDYLNKLYTSEQSNPACEDVRNMIISTLSSKDPKQEDDVIERFPKEPEENNKIKM